MSEQQRIIDVDIHHQFRTASAISEYMPDDVPYQYYSSGAGIPAPTRSISPRCKTADRWSAGIGPGACGRRPSRSARH